MKAAEQAQQRLLDLQAVDTAIAQLEYRRKSLPEHAAIAAAQSVRAKVSADIVAAQTRVSDLELEQAKAESDLVPVRERKVRNQQRVDGGSVGDPKALSALVAEIEHLGRRISDLEDVELEALEALEEANAALTGLQARRTQVEDELRLLVARRDEQLQELNADLADRQTVRASLAAGLPAELLALYDRLRVKGGGVGAAALRQRRCSGCQLAVTQTALVAYRAAAPDEVLRCEECDRILVRVADSGL